MEPCNTRFCARSCEATTHTAGSRAAAPRSLVFATKSCRCSGRDCFDGDGRDRGPSTGLDVASIAVPCHRRAVHSVCLAGNPRREVCFRLSVCLFRDEIAFANRNSAYTSRLGNERQPLVDAAFNCPIAADSLAQRNRLYDATISRSLPKCSLEDRTKTRYVNVILILYILCRVLENVSNAFQELGRFSLLIRAEPQDPETSHSSPSVL